MRLAQRTLEHAVLYMVRSASYKITKCGRLCVGTTSLGREYTNRKIEPLVTGIGGLDVRLYRPEKLIDFVASRLAEGEIVGWFQGQSEIGPRALDNRSVLADPSNAEIKDIVNRKVKHREPFRPTKGGRV